MLEYILLSGCWYLVVGCWYLVVGCWYLVVCRWSLVVGIGFQPKLPTTYNLQPTTDNLQPTTYNLLAIDILFLNNQTTSFVWKTVPCRCMLIAVLYVLVLSFRQLLPSCP